MWMKYMFFESLPKWKMLNQNWESILKSKKVFKEKKVFYFKNPPQWKALE